MFVHFFVCTTVCLCGYVSVRVHASACVRKCECACEKLCAPVCLCIRGRGVYVCV